MPMLIAVDARGRTRLRRAVAPQARQLLRAPGLAELFKQLCMVGGIDRYFQIAAAYATRTSCADRQFEFMQLDVDELRAPGGRARRDSHAVGAVVHAATGESLGDVERITWLEAQERYGSDKPDVRFGLELVELTEVFAATEFKAFQAPCVKGIRARRR
jgi:aspartyl-tRNA synthetase